MEGRTVWKSSVCEVARWAVRNAEAWRRAAYWVVVFLLWDDEAVDGEGEGEEGQTPARNRRASFPRLMKSARRWCVEMEGVAVEFDSV